MSIGSMNRDAPAARTTIERIHPGLIDQAHPAQRSTLELHLERYEFAARFTRDRSVLDLACGVGYGSALLAERGARQVLGVDIDAGAVETARRDYARPGVRFDCCSAYDMRADEPFGAAVSLETIEHLPDPAGFLRVLHRLLAPGAILVGSVPVTPSVDVNIHHLHDFTEGSFRRLLRSEGFEPMEEKRQVQPYSLLRIRGELKSRVWGADIRPNLAAWYLRHPGKALLRGWSLLRDGTRNKYLVVAARRVG